MTEQIWALLPASGVGSRMQANCPKQYLKIQNEYILDITIQKMLSVSGLSGVMVVISADDAYWPSTQSYAHPSVYTATGGAERFHSVLNGLYALKEITSGQDWVMVHDAARPCVRVSDINKLISVASNNDGALLGVPAKDTIKQVGENITSGVEKTLDRSKIWQAFTPQMFRIEVLISALEYAISSGFMVTDDASAMELSGHRPVMVEGASDNIKITQPQDLPLAEWLLTQQKNITDVS